MMISWDIKWWFNGDFMGFTFQSTTILALNHPFIDGFSIIDQPTIGDPLFMETSIYLGKLSYFTNLN